MSEARSQYSKVAIVLHWLIALLIIGQLTIGFYMVGIPKEQAALKLEIYQLHKSSGITILLLTAARLLWRLTHPAPALPEGMKRWEKFAAHGTHYAFYVLLFVIPLLGWAYVSVAPLNVPTMLFGVIHWPHMPFFEGVENRKEVAEIFAESHEVAAKAAIALLVLHVAAALKHHWLDGDDVLSRMLPLVRARK